MTDWRGWKKVLTDQRGKHRKNVLTDEIKNKKKKTLYKPQARGGGGLDRAKEKNSFDKSKREKKRLDRPKSRGGEGEAGIKKLIDEKKEKKKKDLNKRKNSWQTKWKKMVLIDQSEKKGLDWQKVGIKKSWQMK